jgi:hypothetical protein
MRRALVTIILVAIAGAACGDDGATEPSSPATVTSAASTTSSPEPSVPGTTSEAVTTTVGTTTTAGSSTTTAGPAPEPTALDALEPFFTAAADLDRRIREAAIVFNAGFDPDGPAVSEEAADAVDGLGQEPLRLLIPAGMPPELETAVLAVYADLSSRVASLDGGVRFATEHNPVDWVMECLDNGAGSFARFEDDVARARDLAAQEPQPQAAPDSAEAGMLAARLVAIDSMNFGCDSCGGLRYDEQFEVDWEGRTVLGVGFDAEFDGSAWEILIYAC